MSDEQTPHEVALAVDLGGTKIYGALVSRAGEILHAERVPSASDADGALQRLGACIARLRATAQVRRWPLAGISVGAPGVTTWPEGVVTLAPSLGWYDLPLRAQLHAQFALPVLVENDVNLAALGEWRYGAGQGARHLVCVAIGTGIGSGIVLDGRLYRGSRFGAGEIGYMLPSVAWLGTRYEGFGALEQVASGTGIAARAQQLAPGGGADSAEAVFAAARGGAAWARQLVAETVDYLALALANVCCVLDPDVVVLSGGVAQADDLLVAPLGARLDGIVPSLPQIVVSRLGAQAAALGAAALLWQAQGSGQGDPAPGH